MSAASTRTVIYGAFKGMGDLLCAAPAVAWELQRGSAVVLLVFPKLPREFIDLLDFGTNRQALTIISLPTPPRFKNVATFFKTMRGLSPTFAWLSPHSPVQVASWKIPLLLSTIKRLYWRDTIFGGADSEPLSSVFNIRVPVDRNLPYAEREWVAYSRFRGDTHERPPSVTFTQSIVKARSEPPRYDLLIHPGASASNRKWPLGHFCKLIQLIPSFYRIAVVGIPADVAALKSALPATRNIHFSHGSLEHAITEIARTRVALTMDSGPMFFAKAIGVPTVTLFGPSNPKSVVGVDSYVTPIYERNVSCQPCSRPYCRCKSVLCMESIEPETVAARLINLLEARH